MSRPIKFRAWDKRNKKWVQGFTVFKTGAVAVHGGRPKTYESGNPRFVIEQATGLKDHRGKDIYEGDIVKYGGLACAVEYDIKHGHAGFILKRPSGMVPMPLGIPHKTVMEVVSTIHERPELLEQAS